MRFPDRLANRIAATSPAAPYVNLCGQLAEDFSHFECGCPGTWVLSEEPRWYEPWQRPVMTLVWTCSVRHRQGCGRAG